MPIQESDYEKLGVFYLGREYDLKNKRIEEDLVLYDSKDLVTHGVVLGMTGSGKTGLCLAILEEAAIDDIPCIVIDPKGDIANMMLGFPEFRGSDFEPWVDEDEVARSGLGKGEYAQKQADIWKNGLAEWGQSPERLRRFQEKVDITIFTPGSQAGIPVSIMSSLEAPTAKVLEDGELFNERIQSTASSLLTLMGSDAESVQAPEHVLLSAILQHCWQKGEGLSLEILIRHLQQPPFDKIGVIDLESFVPQKMRMALAMKMNALLASPNFSQWLQGVPLDIGAMMRTSTGKPRISILSIAHLNDQERMFFVSLVLNQMLGWMRQQSGTTSLRAMLYMDEIFGYLPPTANPPSKKLLMTLLKQSRAFGLGCLLATQNPVDLDYKALTNIGTWWLGRLQTERDKARLLDGLQGAASEQNGNFDREQMDEMLSSLGKRVFLMHNVHDSQPCIFHVRWVMNYLKGPLTRNQIQTLMEPKREALLAGLNVKTVAQSSNQSEANQAKRPVLGAGVEEYFLPIAGGAEGVSYRPSLWREAVWHVTHEKSGIDAALTRRMICEWVDVEPDSERPLEWKSEAVNAKKSPTDGAVYVEVPGAAMTAKTYDKLADEYLDQLYRNERLVIFYEPNTAAYSKLNETESEFRQRIAHQAREMRDQEVEKLRDKYQKRLQTQEDKLMRANQALAREEAQASQSLWQTIAKVGTTILSVLFSKRKMSASVISKGASSLGSVSRATGQKLDVAQAKERVAAIEAEITQMNQELEEEVKMLQANYEASALKLEEVVVKPYKKDLSMSRCALLWLPFDDRGDQAW